MPSYATLRDDHSSSPVSRLTSGSQDANNETVHVVSRKAFVEFSRTRPRAAEPLDNWYRRARRATWNSLAEVRTDYPHADLVGQCIVFNVGGNKYRLIVKIKFPKKTIFIRFVLTHEEYNKGGWRNDCIA